jgi:hypothetical protein
VVIAAIASSAHALLHVYAHAAGLLSEAHLAVEFFGVLAPAVLLAAAAIVLIQRDSASRAAHRAAA